MNNIFKDQNARRNINRLSAQRYLYSWCKRLRGLQFMLGYLLLPVTSLFLSMLTLWSIMNRDAATQFLAACGGIVLVVEIVANQIIKKKKELAAKIQELFDCDVLSISWNNTAAGKCVEPELVARYAARPSVNQADLADWYQPEEISLLPLALGRLICQRTNVTWDRELRRSYTRWLWFAAALSLGALTVFAAIREMSVGSFFLGVIVPGLPVVVLTLREILGHRDAAARADRLVAVLGETWREALEVGADDATCSLKIRSVQDQIFRHRIESLLLPDFVHNRLKSQRQQEANFSAEEMIREYRNQTFSSET